MRSTRTHVLLALALGATGCTSEALITVGRPHVYDDDFVRKEVARRRSRVRSLADGIQAARINELFGVRQAVRYDVALKARTQVDEIGEGEGGEASVVGRPDLSLPAPVEVPSDLGRTYEGTLRDLIQRDEFVSGYELQYLGDSEFLGEDKSVALVRFDVSINRYVNMGDSPRFAIATFRIFAFKDVGKHSADVTRKIRVYSLSPEYAALVAQESLVSLKLEDYQAQVSGRSGTTDLSGAGRFQRALEETFATLTEVPLQFASHRADNSFAFAFGPRRRIVKRAWINPARWFGNTYKIEYELTPGTRQCWALVVLPRIHAVERLRLRARVEYRSDDFFSPEDNWFLPFRRIGPFGHSDPREYLFSLDFPSAERSKLEAMSNLSFSDKGEPSTRNDHDGADGGEPSAAANQDEDGGEPPSFNRRRSEPDIASVAVLEDQVEYSNITRSFHAWVFPDVVLSPSVTPVTSALYAAAATKIAPNPWYTVYPAGTSSFVLNTAPKLACAEAEVIIGPTRLSGSNVEVVGRHLILATLPATAELEAMRRRGETEVLGHLVLPGHEPRTFRVALRNASSASEPFTSIEPTYARAGEWIILKSTEFDFLKPHTVTFNTQPTNGQRVGSKELILPVPMPKATVVTATQEPRGEGPPNKPKEEQGSSTGEAADTPTAAQNAPPPSQPRPLAVKVIVNGFDVQGRPLTRELTFFYRQ